MREPTLSPADVTTLGLIMTFKKLKFNLSETAKILNRDNDGLAAYLHEHGITVERRGARKGTPKYVHVADIARLAADKSENVAAIRND